MVSAPQLPLPITPETAVKRVIVPALQLMPGAMQSRRAVLMILVIFLQESGLNHRWQVIDLHRPDKKGPARGLGQFERGSRTAGGGVWGIFQHPASRFWLSKVCEALGVPFRPEDIWAAMETKDALAVCASRLLLFTDARALPVPGEEEQAWSYYLRNWRPGAYFNGTPAKRAALRAKFAGHYRTALAATAALDA